MAINKENVFANDRISVQLKPAPKVFCRKCNLHIFWLNNLNKDKPVYPIDFIQVSGVFVGNFICPKCENIVAAFDGDLPKFKTSEGWR